MIKFNHLLFLPIFACLCACAPKGTVLGDPDLHVSLVETRNGSLICDGGRPVYNFGGKYSSMDVVYGFSWQGDDFVILEGSLPMGGIENVFLRIGADGGTRVFEMRNCVDEPFSYVPNGTGFRLMQRDGNGNVLYFWEYVDGMLYGPRVFEPEPVLERYIPDPMLQDVSGTVSPPDSAVSGVDGSAADVDDPPDEGVYADDDGEGRSETERALDLARRVADGEEYD